MSGLSAAIQSAAFGHRVTLLERACQLGGKATLTMLDGTVFDSGPTVITMPWVFQNLFSSCGRRLADYVELIELDPVARHFWPDGSTLDLHQDHDKNLAALTRFAGADESRRVSRWLHRASRASDVLTPHFLCATKPNPLSLAARIGTDIRHIQPFTTMMQSISHIIRDPRLQQLFGRYATYCGSSPFLAPATLNMIVDVELAGVYTTSSGVWGLVEGLKTLASELGVEVITNSKVESVSKNGMYWEVRSKTQPLARADAVIIATDHSTALQSFQLPTRFLGRPVTPPLKDGERSLSAITWSNLLPPQNPPLAVHNVFFSANYAIEFEQLFDAGIPPENPTVYVCAPDRAEPGTGGSPDSAARERVFALINAPANGDQYNYDKRAINKCQSNAEQTIKNCGHSLALGHSVLNPNVLEQRQPGTGGAIYGHASHGWQAAFRRPGQRTGKTGLYLAGGTTHPGPGLPNSVLSGRLAAFSLHQDLASRPMFRKTVTLGGIWTD